MNQNFFWILYFKNGNFISEKDNINWSQINLNECNKINIINLNNEIISTIEINKNGLFPLIFHIKTGIDYLTPNGIIRNELKYFDIGLVYNKNGDCIIHRFNNNSLQKEIFESNIKTIGLTFEQLMNNGGNTNDSLYH